MSHEKWLLEIYRVEDASSSLISPHEFNSLALLRITVVENAEMRFTVRQPAHATAADRITLLDLRAQGFNICIAASLT